MTFLADPTIAQTIVSRPAASRAGCGVGPERAFLGLCAVYVLAGMAFVSALGADGPAAVVRTLASVPQVAGAILDRGGVVLAGLVLPLAFLPRAAGRARIGAAALVGLATILLFLTFTSVKATLPEAVPFHADPALARFDAWLHGGHAPWTLTHRWLGGLPPDLLARIYIDVWLIPAVFFPVLLVLSDRDDARRRRFLGLYLLAWVGIGNLLALAGMSAGPVYHDRITGLAEFGGLQVALTGSGIADSRIGMIQDHLWALYESGRQIAGSGISAFPSVHVAMATVVALYLFERLPRALPVSVALVAVYLFLSVHLGWHYALDGYASILVVLAGWGVLRGRSRRA